VDRRVDRSMDLVAMLVRRWLVEMMLGEGWDAMFDSMEVEFHLHRILGPQSRCWRQL
jgi:hypothetical protein